MTARTRALGQAGEHLAEEHLAQRGARIIARNFRTAQGELDLLVEHEGDLVGVEVKARTVGQVSTPEDAVGFRKLARLEQVMLEAAERFGFSGRGCRIDVVAIDVDRAGNVVRLDHIRDAYG